MSNFNVQSQPKLQVFFTNTTNALGGVGIYELVLNFRDTNNPKLPKWQGWTWEYRRFLHDAGWKFSRNETILVQLGVNSKGFWRWCVALSITSFTSSVAWYSKMKKEFQGLYLLPAVGVSSLLCSVPYTEPIPTAGPSTSTQQHSKGLRSSQIRLPRDKQKM
jgi:hypothetical protein